MDVEESRRVQLLRFYMSTTRVGQYGRHTCLVGCRRHANCVFAGWCCCYCWRCCYSRSSFHLFPCSLTCWSANAGCAGTSSSHRPAEQSATMERVPKNDPLDEMVHRYQTTPEVARPTHATPKSAYASPNHCHYAIPGADLPCGHLSSRFRVEIVHCAGPNALPGHSRQRGRRDGEQASTQQCPVEVALNDPGRGRPPCVEKKRNSVRRMTHVLTNHLPLVHHAVPLPVSALLCGHMRNVQACRPSSTGRRRRSGLESRTLLFSCGCRCGRILGNVEWCCGLVGCVSRTGFR